MSKKTLPQVFKAAADLMGNQCFSQQLYIEMIEGMINDFDMVPQVLRPEALTILQDTLYHVTGNDPVTGCLTALRAHNAIDEIQEYAADAIMLPSLTTMSVVDNSDALKMALMIYASSPEDSRGEKMAFEKIPSLAITYTLLCESAIETKKIIRKELEGKKDEARYARLMEVCQDKLRAFCPYVSTTRQPKPV